MLNYCENKLAVAGPVHDLMRFRAAATGTDKEDSHVELSFQSLLPVTTEEGDNPPWPLWYACRVKEWGTKWDAACPVIMHEECDEVDEDNEEAEGVVVYRFDTAWTPPIPLFDTVSKDYPTLRFRLLYQERGESFQGICEWQQGVRTVDESHDFDLLDVAQMV